VVVPEARRVAVDVDEDVLAELLRIEARALTAEPHQDVAQHSLPGDLVQRGELLLSPAIPEESHQPRLQAGGEVGQALAGERSEGDPSPLELSADALASGEGGGSGGEHILELDG
jgi:hypothetical protein